VYRPSLEKKRRGERKEMEELDVSGSPWTAYKNLLERKEIEDSQGQV